MHAWSMVLILWSMDFMIEFEIVIEEAIVELAERIVMLAGCMVRGCVSVVSRFHHRA